MLTYLFYVLGSLSIFLFLAIIFIWSRYNSFVVSKNQVKTDFSDIAIQIKRKASLIEQLVTMVREYAKHEEGTFENVAKARAALDTSQSVGETAHAQNMFSDTLRSLFSVVENYPTLKANENYISLQEELKNTENHIAQYREEYNRTVQSYNNMIQIFPNLLAAALFNFKPEELFEESKNS